MLHLLIDLPQPIVQAAVIGSAGNARESRPSALLCRRSRGSNTGDAVDTELEAAAAAAAASAAELASLSPRSRSLREVFESLAAGRDVLTQDSLAKWSYVSHSIERGMVSQYQAGLTREEELCKFVAVVSANTRLTCRDLVHMWF